MTADAEGLVPVALVNDRIGLGILVESRQDQQPSALEWQNFGAGHSVVGIEPLTHHVLGNRFARERGEMIWLDHGQSRSYDLRFSVLDGPGQIALAETRIAAIACQPAEDFPQPTGQFASLYHDRRAHG